MILHLKIVGTLLVILAFAHVFIPGYFKWKEELKSLNLFNRQVMYVHTFFIALTVGSMGILNLTSAELLVESELGNRICLGLGVFWLLRLGIQLWGYSSKLWKGKPLETGLHGLFILAWSYFAFTYICAAKIILHV